MVNAGIGLIRKRETTFLQFTSLDTEPGSLVFEYSKGWSLPKLDLGVEKAGLNDLTTKDRERLTDFVTNKARAIAALAGSGFVVSP